MLKKFATIILAGAAALSLATAAQADTGTGESWRDYDGTTIVKLYSDDGSTYTLTGTGGRCNGPGNDYDYMSGLINGRNINFNLLPCGGNIVNLCIKINRGGYECSAYASRRNRY